MGSGLGEGASGARVALRIPLSGNWALTWEFSEMTRTENRHPLQRIASRWSGVLALGSLLFAPGCSEPCSSERVVTVDQNVTPFEDGRSVFSVCERCPELPPSEGGSEAGPATGCLVRFDDGLDQAGVTCLYGPNHATTWAGANDAILDVPNELQFCEQRCPDEDAFHGCSIIGSASGVEPISCSYGQSC